MRRYKLLGWLWVLLLSAMGHAQYTVASRPFLGSTNKVQFVAFAGCATTTNPINDISVSYTPTAGNTLIAFTWHNVTTTIPTVTDNLGDTFTALDSDTYNTIVYDLIKVSSGITTITAGAIGAYMGLCVYEYSGVQSVGTVYTGSSVSGTTYTVTEPLLHGNDILIGVFEMVHSGSFVTPTTTSGTLRGDLWEFYDSYNTGYYFTNWLQDITSPTIENLTLSGTLSDTVTGNLYRVVELSWHE